MMRYFQIQVEERRTSNRSSQQRSWRLIYYSQLNEIFTDISTKQN
jgi:hypothetical protein